MKDYKRSIRTVIGTDLTTGETLTLSITARRSDIPRRCVRVLASVGRTKDADSMWESHVMYHDYQETLACFTPERITKRIVDEAFHEAVDGAELGVIVACAIAHYRGKLGSNFQDTNTVLI